MKLKIWFYLLLTYATAFSAWLDTGYHEFTQPNGVKFIARLWGDEYFHRFETQDGYCIFQKGNWYYYAVLNEIGDYTASDYKVGIDNPLCEIKI